MNVTDFTIGNYSTSIQAKPDITSIRAPLKIWKADLDIELRELEQYGLLNLEMVIMENYKNVQLTPIGKVLRVMMELNELENGDIEEIAKLLRYVETNSLF